MDRHDPNINPHIHHMGTYHQHHTVAYDPGLLAAWNQEQMGPHNPNPMGTHQQDNTGVYDSSLLAAWNQEQMGALNPIHVRTHHQAQTDAYVRSLVGTYSQGQVDFYHQSEIDSHHPSYMNPQLSTNIDDLTGIFRLTKPIKTRANQSPRADRFHDGSRTARIDRSVYQNPNVHEQRPMLDTSRINIKKPSTNPRRRSEHP